MDAFAPVTEKPPASDRTLNYVGSAGRSGSSRLGLSAVSLWTWLGSWRPFFLLVILPTILAAAVEYGIAANQYQSEAHFIVRSNDQGTGASTSGLGQILGLGAPVTSEAHSIGDYLISHDAVAALQGRLDLIAIFRRPEADPLTRLQSATPTPESLLKYYRHQVSVAYSADTGITELSVRAFRPADAQALAETLLQLGETKVNTFNQRALRDTLSVARQQLADAEADVAQTQRNVTGFRQVGRDIDPARSSAAGITLAAGLEGQLAQARAQLAAMSRAVAPTSPQFVAMASQVRALAAQVGDAQGRLAGPQGSMASGLGAYESLLLRQQFAAKHYEAAATALETARTTALKQQLFVVRVVEPNLPDKSLYPARLKVVATIFFALLLTYGIGWLILAGVREHAA